MPRGKARKSTSAGAANSTQERLILPGARTEQLDTPALETWLWDAACAIRGATDAPKFKDFILPLIFYKRLSDVFDDEVNTHVEQYGNEALARKVITDDHADALREQRPAMVRFFVPAAYQWESLRNHGPDGRLGEFVTTAMRETAHLNPDLQGVLDVRDFNERQSGQRILDDNRLALLIEVISRHRLGLQNTEPDMLGRAYEYLLRKFAEGQGQSAGEFYTPKEVGFLMAELLDPQPQTKAHDPTCGSGGLLIKLRLLFERKHPAHRTQAPKLYGQELNPTTFAMAKMNMFLHDYTDSQIAIGDTFTQPGFARAGAGLQRFDTIVANPMWNQDNYNEAFYDSDSWGRFAAGHPPASSADWGWVQHILACLNDHGRAAIVLDTGAVSRGSGGKSSNKEKTIRAALIEQDVIEGVVLLPENMFYNTTAPGIILLLRHNKPAVRREQIMLINASTYFVKGKPKNALTQMGIDSVASAYHAWETQPKLSRVITLEEARAADYNLSPSQFVSVNERVQHRALDEIMADIEAARIARAQADAELARVLTQLNRISDL